MGVNKIFSFKKVFALEKSQLGKENYKTLQVFKNKGFICVSCSRVGTYFTYDGVAYRLYSEDGMLMTKDHILPKSRGGNNTIKNLQTMCLKCNQAKGNAIPERLKTKGLVKINQSKFHKTSILKSLAVEEFKNRVKKMTNRLKTVGIRDHSDLKRIHNYFDFLDGKFNLNDEEKSLLIPNVEKIYNMFKNEKALIVYFSDHGEVINSYRHGHGYSPGFKDEYKVPLVFISTIENERLNHLSIDKRYNNKDIYKMVNYLTGVSDDNNFSQRGEVIELSPDNIQKYDEMKETYENN